MGAFHVSCQVENHVHRSLSAEVPQILVDTGRECTWVSAETLGRLRVKVEEKDMTFVMANGKILTRNVGFAVIRIGEHVTIDEVVFGQEGDLETLGARTLEGLNLVVDPTRKRLVAGGPVPAA
ncbi:MAG TPA: aspartyl protease family protein [Planctomycetota bacterium]|nr:aspartyl protease family protein [Planctomycetota bacterium]